MPIELYFKLSLILWEEYEHISSYIQAINFAYNIISKLIAQMRVNPPSVV